MQHQQNRNDFAGAQTGLRPARRGAVSEQIGFPLRQKRLAKIIHCAEGFDEPLQHVDLPWHGWFGSFLRIIDSQCVNASNTRYRGSITRITGFSASNVVKRKDFLKPRLEEKNKKKWQKQEWHPYFKGFLGLCKKLLFPCFWKNRLFSTRYNVRNPLFGLNSHLRQVGGV